MYIEKRGNQKSLTNSELVRDVISMELINREKIVAKQIEKKSAKEATICLVSLLEDNKSFFKLK